MWSHNQSRVPSLRCRDSGPYFFPKCTLGTRSNRQPPIRKHARFARTCAPRVSWWTVYYCNTTVITCSRKPCPQRVPQFTLNPSAERRFVRVLRVAASVARHGERCGTRPRARRVYAGPECADRFSPWSKCRVERLRSSLGTWFAWSPPIFSVKN
jgi:hypothetical protein